MKSTKNFLKFLFLLSICTSVFFACQKETNETIKTDNTVIPLNLDGNLSASARTEGSLNATLDGIEESLNFSHGSPDQSIGTVSVTEREMILPLTNGNLTQAQVELVHDAALTVWAENYDTYSSPTKQALVVDIANEVINGGRVKIKISSCVGETQTAGTTVGCNPNFPMGSYFWSSKIGNPNIYPKFADIELTKKFNQKVQFDFCNYYTDIKTCDAFLTTNQILNDIQMDDIYCTFLDKLNKFLADNPEFSLVSTKIEGAYKSPNNVHIFNGTFTIGIKRTKKSSPCIKAPAPIKPLPK